MRDLSAGTVLAAEMLTVKKPVGPSLEQLDQVIGRRLRRDIPANRLLRLTTSPKFTIPLPRGHHEQKKICIVNSRANYIGSRPCAGSEGASRRPASAGRMLSAAAPFWQRAASSRATASIDGIVTRSSKAKSHDDGQVTGLAIIDGHHIREPQARCGTDRSGPIRDVGDRSSASYMNLPAHTQGGDHRVH